MSKDQTVTEKNRRLLLRLLVIVVAMFIFAIFIMPPIYNVFCELTGLNGKTSNVADSGPRVMEDKGRTIQVQFLAGTDPGLPWDFRSNEPVLSVHPGEVVKTSFHVKNRDGNGVLARAVPSISPSEATRYFKKTACFCFSEQRLNGGEEKDMALIFYIDPAIPKHISTITLAYKFYKQTDNFQ
jgi:cytochrome c oxidase assembly protein subunit 11